MEDEFLPLKGPLETGHELPAEDAAQDSHRQKESRRRPDPALPVLRQTAARHDTMNVRMALESLAPGVKDAQKADLGSEMFGVGGNFE